MPRRRRGRSRNQRGSHARRGHRTYILFPFHFSSGFDNPGRENITFSFKFWLVRVGNTGQTKKNLKN